MEKPLLLTFKTTTSRGRDTYGYSIVSLYVDGVKTTSCNGGGYDMQGTALALYLQREYQERLMSIADRAYTTRTQNEDMTWEKVENKDGLYGMSATQMRKSDRRELMPIHVTLDGGCGQNSIEKIAEAAGITFTSTKTGRNSYGYFLTINN